MDAIDSKKLADRDKDFPDYRFYDKALPGNKMARMTVMVAKNIKSERLDNMENEENPPIVFRVKDSKAKWTNCIAFYRQWKDLRDGETSSTENIQKQVTKKIYK